MIWTTRHSSEGEIILKHDATTDMWIVEVKAHVPEKSFFLCAKDSIEGIDMFYHPFAYQKVKVAA